METISILISKISGLSKEEQSKVYDHLNRLLEEPSFREHALLKIGNELHEREAIGCPSCKSEQWIKFGKYKGPVKYITGPDEQIGD